MTHFSKRPSFIALGLCIVFVSLIQTKVVAQEPSDFFKQNPADQLAPELVKDGLAQIQWKVQLLSKQRSSLEESLRHSRDQIESIDRLIEDVSTKLPVETRFVDASSRSKIASQALEALLSAKLDLVVLKTRIAQIETQAKTQKESKAVDKQQLAAINLAEYSVMNAEAELEKEASNIERVTKLYEKSFSSQEDLNMAKYKYQIARLKLEKLRSDLEMAIDQPDDPRADELADLRLQCAPLEARIKAAEQFLEKFVDANRRQAQIDALNRERNQVIERSHWIEKRQFELDMKLLESNSLKEMLDGAGEKIEN